MVSSGVFKIKSAARVEAETIAILKKDKNKTFFRIPGEGKPGEFRNMLAPYAPRVAAYIRAKYPNALVANEDWITFVRGWTDTRDNRGD